jgi:hypothetical protein
MSTAGGDAPPHTLVDIIKQMHDQKKEVIEQMRNSLVDLLLEERHHYRSYISLVMNENRSAEDNRSLDDLTYNLQALNEEINKVNASILGAEDSLDTLQDAYSIFV